MVMLGVLVIIKRISMYELMILATKIIKIGQLRQKLGLFFYSTLPEICLNRKIVLISISIDHFWWFLWLKLSIHICWFVLWGLECYWYRFQWCKWWKTTKNSKVRVFLVASIRKMALISVLIDQFWWFLWLKLSIHTCWFVLWWLECSW